MADGYEFTKVTSSGARFRLRLHDDGTLVEWEDGADEASGWGGTWDVSFPMKAGPFLHVDIGPYRTTFETDIAGEMRGEDVRQTLVGIEEEGDDERGETRLHVAGDATAHSALRSLLAISSESRRGHGA